jgi:type II secretory pathway pseudopilin PulG
MDMWRHKVKKMKRYQNEHGMTLVEMLAAFSLFIIFIVLFYNILTSTVGNLNERMKREEARREANYVFSLLTNIHQTSSRYVIEPIDETSFQIVYIVDGDVKETTVDTSPYKWTLTINGQNVEKSTEMDVTNSENLIIDVSLQLAQIEKRQDILEFETTISRLTKANGGSE